LRYDTTTLNCEEPDNAVPGGRQYFTAKTSDDRYPLVAGENIAGGPETWNFEFDQSFWIQDSAGQTLEVVISLLEGGRYAVRSRAGEWPIAASGGWAVP